MKTACGAAVIFVSLVSISGCKHKTVATPPPQAQAPASPPSNMAHTPTLPALPPPSTPNVVVATTEEPAPEPVHPHKVQRHKPAAAKPAAPSDTATTSQAGEKVASAMPTPDVSPIGQLSSSGESTGSQGRHDIEQLINNTENGLNGIKRSLSADEQLTSAQIKTFLTKAKQALVDNDLDGAQTLATKAKVLLDELTTKK